jgi:hypothetical protein
MNTLKQAIKGRVAEIQMYELNIFNYEHAADQIGSDPTLQEFKQHLCALSKSDRVELRKAQIILNALKAQLDSTRPRFLGALRRAIIRAFGGTY